MPPPDPPNIAPPVPPGAPAPPAAPVPPAPPLPPTPDAGPSFVPADLLRKTSVEHELFDAFYTDERNTAMPRELHPIKCFWNMFTGFRHFTFGPQKYENAIALSGGHDFPNPLIDGTLALPEKLVDARFKILFNDPSTCRIFVPTRLSDDFNSFWSRSSAKKPTAKVALFFGVETEINSFGLRKFFDNTNSVVITILSKYEAWGNGITTERIRQLLDASRLKGIDFSVEVMAAYSGAYRGLNETVINNLVELKDLRRLIYLDAFYNHDDTPKPKKPPPLYKGNTLWAIDTALSKSPNAELFIYAYSISGTRRATKFKKGAPPPRPKVPIDDFMKQRFPKRIMHFIDLEYDPRLRDDKVHKFESICLARLIQSGIDQDFERKEIAELVQGEDESDRKQTANNILALVDVLPERGSLGTWGRSGFIDLFKWVAASPQKDAISQFPADEAFALVAEFNLLGRWTKTTSSDPKIVNELIANGVPKKLIPGYWLRHVDFVQEICKECLLP